MNDQTEKRTFARTETHCRIRYTVADQDQVLDGVCLNISAAGILFRSEQLIERGRAVEIHTFPDNPATPPLTAFVEILRCKPQGEYGYQIAAAIKGIKAN